MSQRRRAAPTGVRHAKAHKTRANTEATHNLTPLPSGPSFSLLLTEEGLSQLPFQGYSSWGVPDLKMCFYFLILFTVFRSNLAHHSRPRIRTRTPGIQLETSRVLLRREAGRDPGGERITKVKAFYFHYCTRGVRSFSFPLISRSHVRKKQTNKQVLAGNIREKA